MTKKKFFYSSDSSSDSDEDYSKQKTPEKRDTRISSDATLNIPPKVSELSLRLQAISMLEVDAMKEDAQKEAESRRKRESNPLMKAYKYFHTSAMPTELIKREEQCKDIEKFIRQAIGPNSSVHNRSIYVSGVPGTGKTACVTKVIEKLQKDKKKSAIKFSYVYINGLELVRPQHVFSEIYDALYPSKRNTAPKTAREKLSKIFNYDDKKRDPILLVVDELDMLCNKSQDVVYDLFDWAATEESRLSIIAIANTLDLPERVLKQRVSSRLGYNRITFQPYNHDEIIAILTHRIKGRKVTINEAAFKFIARKVAAVSGDLRKSLELMRRAIEIAVENDETELAFTHATEAVKEGLLSLPMLFTKSLSLHQELLLRAVVQEIRAISLEEVDFWLVYECYRRIAGQRAVDCMEMAPASALLNSLESTGYISMKKSGLVSRRISLKMSADEIEFLLRNINTSAD